MHGRRGITREWTHQGLRGDFTVFDGTWPPNASGNLIDASNLPTEPVATPGPEADAARARLQPLLDGIPDPVPGATSTLETCRCRNDVRTGRFCGHQPQFLRSLLPLAG